MLPLETYVDTLTKLLEPQIQWSRVASILDLLSNIEFYRLLASEKVPLVLGRMDHEQTEFFATVHAPEEQVEMRRAFLQIISELCTVDILRCFMDSAAGDLAERWNDYFPRDTERQIARPRFHYKLSQSDIGFLHQASHKCYALMQEATTCAENNREKGQSLSDAFRSPALRERYYTPIDVKMHKELVQGYIANVVELLQELDNIAEPL